MVMELSEAFNWMNKTQGKSEEDKEKSRQQELELKELKAKVKEESIKIKQEREFSRMKKQFEDDENNQVSVYEASREELQLMEELYGQTDGVSQDSVLEKLELMETLQITRQ